MKLSPSLKQKKRYIVFEIISGDQFSISEVKKEVDAALLLFLGQLGMSKASPMLVKEKFNNNKIILKVNHKWVDEAISAMLLVKTIKNKSVVMKSVITSGTLKKASTYLK